MERYEIDKLKELPIEEVCGRLGINVVRGWALCPHHADHTPSMHVDRRRNGVKCFACGFWADPISLTREVLGVGFLEATQWLAREYGVILSSDGPYPPTPSPARGKGSGHISLDGSLGSGPIDSRPLSPSPFSRAGEGEWSHSSGSLVDGSLGSLKTYHPERCNYSTSPERGKGQGDRGCLGSRGFFFSPLYLDALVTGGDSLSMCLRQVFEEERVRQVGCEYRLGCWCDRRYCNSTGREGYTT